MSDKLLRKIPISDYQTYNINLESFDCGKKDINNHLSNPMLALSNHNNCVNATELFLLDDELIGFVTKGLQNYFFEDPYKDESKEFRCLELEYLAVDLKYQGNNIGKFLIKYILSEGISISQSIGLRGISAQAQADVTEFYEKYGFKYLGNYNTTEGNLYIYDLKEYKQTNN